MRWREGQHLLGHVRIRIHHLEALHAAHVVLQTAESWGRLEVLWVDGWVRMGSYGWVGPGKLHQAAIQR